MPTSIPYLRIEQEQPSQLTLVSSAMRWLIMFFSLFFAVPLILMSFLALSGNYWTLSILIMSFGLLILILPLLFISGRSHMVIDSNSRLITLNSEYWLGVGSLGRTRGKSWKMDEITNINIILAGIIKRIEIELNGKKEIWLLFSPKANKDAQRSYDILQSWLRDLPFHTSEKIVVVDEQTKENKSQQALKSAEILLYCFGAFRLFSGVLGLFTDSIIASSFSIHTITSILTGLIYLACGYGTKHRSEYALWIAILVVISERLFNYWLTKFLGGEWELSKSLFVWIFVFFVVSSLWRAIQSIRSMENNPKFEPPA